MLSRPILLNKRLLICDLTILPFLAPRVFAPWPKILHSRRAYAPAQHRDERHDPAEEGDSRVEDLHRQMEEEARHSAHESPHREENRQRQNPDFIGRNSAKAVLATATHASSLRTQPTNFSDDWEQTAFSALANHQSHDGAQSGIGIRNITINNEAPSPVDDSTSRAVHVIPSKQTATMDSSFYEAYKEIWQPETQASLPREHKIPISRIRKLNSSPNKVLLLERERRRLENLHMADSVRLEIRRKRREELELEREYMKQKSLHMVARVRLEIQKNRQREEHLKLRIARDDQQKAQTSRFSDQIQGGSDIDKLKKASVTKALSTQRHGVSNMVSKRLAVDNFDLHKSRKQIRKNFFVLAKEADGRVRRYRPQMVRLGIGSDSYLNSFQSSWTKNFAKLNTTLIQSPDTSQHLRYVPSVKIRRYIQSIRSLSCEAITATWASHSPEFRIDQWPDIMLGLLHYSPQAALKFLIATSFRPYPPSYAISDSLWLIVKHFFSHEDGIRPPNVDALFSTIIRIVEHFEYDYIHLTQATIYTLLKYLNTEQTLRFYGVLYRTNHPVSSHTAKHLITSLAEKRQTALALDTLRWLHDTGHADLTRPAFQSVFSTVLLSKNRSQSLDAPSDSDIVGFMLDHGIQPNIITYNILLRNAIEAGDSKTAWQIHQMMVENSIAPDAYTYAILLNDAKLRMDRAEIDRIRSIITSTAKVDQPLITDLLHAKFLIAEDDRKAHLLRSHASRQWQDSLPNDDPPPAFKHMVDFYSQYFDTGPLLKVLPDYPGIPPPDKTKWHPQTPVLVVMLIALFKELKSSNPAIVVYNNFLRRIEERDPDFLPLSQSTHIYDAVIMCFGRFPETLKHCTRVVGHMLSSHVKSNTEGEVESLKHSVDDIQTRASNVHPAPSVRTWSVLLKVYMDNEQPRAAEKVLSMMRERGINPNQVTWNSLVAGYARLQDVTNTVNAIERFEAEGYQVDTSTMGSLQAILNRDALIEALKKKVTAPNQSPDEMENLSKHVDTFLKQVQENDVPVKANRTERESKRINRETTLQDHDFIDIGDFVFPKDR